MHNQFFFSKIKNWDLKNLTIQKKENGMVIMFLLCTKSSVLKGTKGTEFSRMYQCDSMPRYGDSESTRAHTQLYPGIHTKI
jgi:hypothetical protein